MIKQLIQNIEQAYRLGLFIPESWQAFWRHFGIKGNEPFKGEKPITTQQVEVILTETEIVLSLGNEPHVNHNILEGIECLPVYAILTEAQTDALNKLRSTYDSTIRLHNFVY